MAITINGSGITSANIADGTITASDISASEVKNLKSGRKNLIINGGFDVWQRGTSFTSAGYTADRWRQDGQLTVSRSADIPSGMLLTYSAKYENTTGSAQNNRTYLENINKILPNGISWTLSYWVKVVSGGVKLDLGDSGVSNFATNATASSWARVTYTSNSRNDSYGGDNAFLDVFLYANTECYITGVQLELGSVATDFEHRSYGEELALCQRFYLNLDETRVHIGGTPGTGSSYDWYIPIMYPVEMRTVPTATYSYTGSGATSNGFFSQGSAKHYGKFSVRPTTTTECNVMADTLRLDAEL